MMSGFTLDAYDKKLLFYLDQDARASYVQLAKKVGLSKDAVKYRMKNYLKMGLLGGFYTLVDSSKLGYYSFRVYFSFSNVSLEDERKVYDYLSQQKNVFYLMSVQGSFDGGFGYFSKSLIEFTDFLKNFEELFSCVHIYKEGLFIQLSHFDRNYLVDKKRLQVPKAILQEPRQVDYDKIDFKILQLLSQDARAPVVDIAHKVGLTSKAVIYRMKNLEKRGIILGYKPKLNLDKIGYSMYKVDLYVENKKTEKMIREFVLTLPNIIHSERVFGGSDFEFDVECADHVEFERIINIIKKAHGKDIHRIEHYRTTAILKTRYLPE